MKRMLSLSLSALLLLSALVGCGSKDSGTASKTPEEYTEAYKTAIESARDDELNEAVPVVTSTEEDMAALVLPLIGVTDENADAFAVAISPMNIKAYGVAAIHPAEGKSEEVLEGVNAFVEQQKQSFEQYLADQYEIAGNARLETLEDGTILLVMCEDQDAVFDAIRDTIEELKAAVLDDLKKVFRPEFLNRLDETIVFTQLGRTEIQAIARRMLERVGERMKALGVTLRFTDRALETLADQGFDPDYGARPLRRTIRAQVEDVAAEQLLSGALQAGDTALVDGAENGLRLYAQPAGTQALNTKENEL